MNLGLTIILILFCGVFCLTSFYLGVRWKEYAIKACRKLYNKYINKNATRDVFYSKMNEEQKMKIGNAIKISFTGDLLLLRDMVERAYNSSSHQYNFAPMFQYVKKYWKESDLSIGVFEGPLAGESKNYTTSNYDDGYRLYMNFPDNFAQAVKDAGINLVTLANNHLLDMGIAGQERTLDVLDKVGLDHIGSYRNQAEHDTIQIREIRGKRIAFLSYTYGSEYTDETFFFDEKTSFRTDSVVCRKSKYFRQNVKKVVSDFERVKASNPDMIIVIPHIGKQFRHKPDRNQRFWCKLFVQLGADIIFSDHPHAVQPIEWRKNRYGKNTLIVHCPGNFINSYIDYDGDASMVVEAYVDPVTCEPFATSCIPIYSYCHEKDGQYIGLPIEIAIHDKSLYSQFSVADYKRLCAVNKLVLRTSIGVEPNIDNIQDRYYSFASGGYVRQSVRPMSIKPEYHGSMLLKTLNHIKKVCFVGDSITDGMKNGGYGWYEPLMTLYPQVEVDYFALGGMTSTYFVSHKEEIAHKNAELYVIALGCNDIRYRNPNICAMNATLYIKNIEELCQSILEINPCAKFVFISPWESHNPDKYCYIPVEEKNRLYQDYSTALETYAKAKGALYINPNPYIWKTLYDANGKKDMFWIDHIHPNADEGIRLFSEACILASIEK